MKKEFKIREIENGFIIYNNTTDGTGNFAKEHCFEFIEQAFEFLKNEYRPIGKQKEVA